MKLNYIVDHIFISQLSFFGITVASAFFLFQNLEFLSFSKTFKSIQEEIKNNTCHERDAMLVTADRGEVFLAQIEQYIFKRVVIKHLPLRNGKSQNILNFGYKPKKLC